MPNMLPAQEFVARQRATVAEGASAAGKRMHGSVALEITRNRGLFRREILQSGVILTARDRDIISELEQMLNPPE